MSSVCNRSPWRTTASKERAKGLGTRWNTNTQTYLKLFDYQSASPALEDKNKKTCEIMQPFKKKTEQALSYFLASTWQNWMKRREIERIRICQFQAWAEGRGLTPLTLSSLRLPAAGAESDRDWLSCYLGTSGFFLQYSDPLHHLHFSPKVLLFQLTKHLT